MGWTSPQQLLHNRLDLDSRQGANFKQQQVWPVDECFCALTLVDQFGSLRYLYHQCFSLLSCCQLTYSFHDSMSGRRSQAPRQPPPSWDPHLLLPVLISIGDYILLHACIIALTCMVSCSFLQCLGAQGMPCSRPIATLTPWYPSALPGAPVEGTRLSTTPRHTHLEDHLPSNLVFMCDIFTWYPWHLESWLSASSLYYAEKQRHKYCCSLLLHALWGLQRHGYICWQEDSLLCLVLVFLLLFIPWIATSEPQKWKTGVLELLQLEQNKYLVVTAACLCHINM